MPPDLVSLLTPANPDQSVPLNAREKRCPDDAKRWSGASHGSSIHAGCDPFPNPDAELWSRLKANNPSKTWPIRSSFCTCWKLVGLVGEDAAIHGLHDSSIAVEGCSRMGQMVPHWYNPLLYMLKAVRTLD